MGKGISETAFASQVEDLLQRFGWRWMHMKPAQSGKGRWMTRTNPEGVGFPDYCIVSDQRYRKDNRLIFAELKDEKSEPTEEQDGWLGDLRECVKMLMIEPIEVRQGRAFKVKDFGKVIPNLEVYLWRPSQIEEIAEILSGADAATRTRRWRSQRLKERVNN